MKRGLVGAAAAALLVAACSVDGNPVGVNDPAPPRAVDATYYAGAVTVTWELAPDWDGEAFRVYARRSTDASYYLVAEVTSCGDALCSYTDTNVLAGRSYDYYVAAVDPRSGSETASADAVRVAVPQPTPPPVPDQIAVVALDHANYVHWSDASRDASDFSFYRVYLKAPSGTSYVLGETDSEGFLDQLAQNGLTYTYFVSAVDQDGHESAGSVAAKGTPRPDYQAEWMYDWFDRPAASGFRFRASDQDNPVVSGSDATRQFRLETDADGWWLVPGANTDVYPNSWSTTALKCGPAADADCTDVSRAPTSGYVHQDIGLEPQSSYVLRVRGDDGQTHYGVIRVIMLGSDQNGHALMIFDWAYQLQPGAPDLAPHPAPAR